MKLNLRLLYLYLFSFVGLLIIVVGSIQIVNLGLKTLVFKNADVYIAYPTNLPPSDPNYISPEAMMTQQKEQTRNQRQSELANAISMIAVGFPLYLYHWKLIGKERDLV